MLFVSCLSSKHIIRSWGLQVGTMVTIIATIRTYSLRRWGVTFYVLYVWYETPDVTPCRTSPPMPIVRTCLAQHAWCNTMSSKSKHALGIMCLLFVWVQSRINKSIIIVHSLQKCTLIAVAWTWTIVFRNGEWYGWKPSWSSNFSIRALRAYPVIIEITQTVPCRAIRGNSISVNSTLPPLHIIMYDDLAH